jgi:hypothetical protein
MKGDIKLEVRGNVDFLTEFPQISFFDAMPDFIVHVAMYSFSPAKLEPSYINLK